MRLQFRLMINSHKVMAALSVLLLTACAGQLPQPVSAEQRSVTRAARTAEQDRAPLKLPLRDPKIVVKKAKRRLLLFSAGKLVRTYRIGLGLSPSGNKVRAGDRRTPEGEFYIRSEEHTS